MAKWGYLQTDYFDFQHFMYNLIGIRLYINTSNAVTYFITMERKMDYIDLVKAFGKQQYTIFKHDFREVIEKKPRSTRALDGGEMVFLYCKYLHLGT